jgi:hypothetical protein
MMRNLWNIPKESDFVIQGMIGFWYSSQTEQGLILLLLWMAWHLRNNAIHEDGKATIHQSVNFLINYACDLNLLTPSI